MLDVPLPPGPFHLPAPADPHRLVRGGLPLPRPRGPRAGDHRAQERRHLAAANRRARAHRCDPPLRRHARRQRDPAAGRDPRVHPAWSIPASPSSSGADRSGTTGATPSTTSGRPTARPGRSGGSGSSRLNPQRRLVEAIRAERRDDPRERPLAPAARQLPPLRSLRHRRRRPWSSTGTRRSSR